MWKAGVSDISELVERYAGARMESGNVRVPFLSVLGMQEGEFGRSRL
jgi:hypothetical protein